MPSASSGRSVNVTPASGYQRCTTPEVSQATALGAVGVQAMGSPSVGCTLPQATTGWSRLEKPAHSRCPRFRRQAAGREKKDMCNIVSVRHIATRQHVSLPPSRGGVTASGGTDNASPAPRRDPKVCGDCIAKDRLPRIGHHGVRAGRLSIRSGDYRRWIPGPPPPGLPLRCRGRRRRGARSPLGGCRHPA